MFFRKKKKDNASDEAASLFLESRRFPVKKALESAMEIDFGLEDESALIPDPKEMLKGKQEQQPSAIRLLESLEGQAQPVVEPELPAKDKPVFNSPPITVEDVAGANDVPLAPVSVSEPGKDPGYTDITPPSSQYFDESNYAASQSSSMASMGSVDLPEKEYYTLPDTEAPKPFPQRELEYSDLSLEAESQTFTVETPTPQEEAIVLPVESLDVGSTLQEQPSAGEMSFLSQDVTLPEGVDWQPMESLPQNEVDAARHAASLEGTLEGSSWQRKEQEIPLAYEEVPPLPIDFILPEDVTLEPAETSSADSQPDTGAILTPPDVEQGVATEETASQSSMFPSPTIDQIPLAPVAPEPNVELEVIDVLYPAVEPPLEEIPTVEPSINQVVEQQLSPSTVELTPITAQPSVSQVSPVQWPGDDLIEPDLMIPPSLRQTPDSEAAFEGFIRSLLASARRESWPTPSVDESSVFEAEVMHQQQVAAIPPPAIPAQQTPMVNVTQSQPEPVVIAEAVIPQDSVVSPQPTQSPPVAPVAPLLVEPVVQSSAQTPLQVPEPEPTFQENFPEPELVLQGDFMPPELEPIADEEILEFEEQEPLADEEEYKSEIEPIADEEAAQSQPVVPDMLPQPVESVQSSSVTVNELILAEAPDFNMPLEPVSASGSMTIPDESVIQQSSVQPEAEKAYEVISVDPRPPFPKPLVKTTLALSDDFGVVKVKPKSSPTHQATSTVSLFAPVQDPSSLDLTQAQPVTPPSVEEPVIVEPSEPAASVPTPLASSQPAPVIAPLPEVTAGSEVRPEMAEPVVLISYDEFATVVVPPTTAADTEGHDVSQNLAAVVESYAETRAEHSPLAGEVEKIEIPAFDFDFSIEGIEGEETGVSGQQLSPLYGGYNAGFQDYDWSEGIAEQQQSPQVEAMQPSDNSGADEAVSEPPEPAFVDDFPMIDESPDFGAAGADEAEPRTIVFDFENLQAEDPFANLNVEVDSELPWYSEEDEAEPQADAIASEEGIRYNQDYEEDALDLTGVNEVDEVDEAIDIIASAPLVDNFQVMVVHHEGIYALMADNGMNAAMLKSFDHNPLAEDTRFVVTQEAILGNKAMFIVQIGDWQGIVSLEGGHATLQTEV